MDIRTRIKEKAREKGLTLSDLARRLNTTPQMINHYLTISPRLETLEKISGVIGCSVADLIQDNRGEHENGVFCPHCGKFIHLTTTPENGKSK